MPPRKKTKIRNSTDNSVNWLNDINVRSARNNRRHTTHANIYDIPKSPEPLESPEPPEETETVGERLHSRRKPLSVAKLLRSDDEQHKSPSGDEQMNDVPEQESHDEDSNESNGSVASLAVHQGSDLTGEHTVDNQLGKQRQNVQVLIPEEPEHEEGEDIREEREEEQDEPDGDVEMVEVEEEQDELNGDVEVVEVEEQRQNHDSEDEESEDEREESFSTPPHYSPQDTSRDRPSINVPAGNNLNDVQHGSSSDSQDGSLVSKSDDFESVSPAPRATSATQAIERESSVEHQSLHENQPVNIEKHGPGIGPKDDLEDEPEYEPENEPEDEPEYESEDDSPNEPEDEDIARLDPELKDWLVETVETTDPKRQWMKFYERAFDLPNYVCRPMPKSFEDALLLIARQREVFIDLEDRLATEGLPPNFQAEISHLCTSIFSEIQGILNFPSIPCTKHNPIKAGRLVIQLEGYLLPHMAILVILAFKSFTEFGTSAISPFTEVLNLVEDCCGRIDCLRDYFTSSRKHQRSWKLGVSARYFKRALKNGKLNVHLPVGVVQEEPETTPTLLGHWKYAEVVALRYALQTYRGSDRYIMMKMHYGTELSRHTIEDLRLKARELGLE